MRDVPIPALTLTQPWATLVAIGAKRIETRTWRTHHRGTIAIHAAKGFPAWAKAMMGDPTFRRVLAAAGYHRPADLPLGMVIAVAELSGCRPIGRGPGLDGQLSRYLDPRTLSGQERVFGDYTPGRFAWLFNSVVALKEPVPARGAVGLWTWEWDPVADTEAVRR